MNLADMAKGGWKFEYSAVSGFVAASHPKGGRQTICETRVVEFGDDIAAMLNGQSEESEHPTLDSILGLARKVFGCIFVELCVDSVGSGSIAPRNKPQATLSWPASTNPGKSIIQMLQKEIARKTLTPADAWKTILPMITGKVDDDVAAALDVLNKHHCQPIERAVSPPPTPSHPQPTPPHVGPESSPG